MVNIDGTVIFNENTGETICDIEEIENLEHAKEIISLLIEEHEKALDMIDHLENDRDYLEERLVDLTSDRFEY